MSKALLESVAQEIGLENIVVGRQNIVEGIDGDIVLYGEGSENGQKTYTELRMGRHGQEETGRIVEHTYREKGRGLEYTFREWKTPQERNLSTPYLQASTLTLNIGRLNNKRTALTPL